MPEEKQGLEDKQGGKSPKEQWGKEAGDPRAEID